MVSLFFWKQTCLLATGGPLTRQGPCEDTFILASLGLASNTWLCPGVRSGAWKRSVSFAVLLAWELAMGAARGACLSGGWCRFAELSLQGSGRLAGRCTHPQGSFPLLSEAAWFLSDSCVCRTLDMPECSHGHLRVPPTAVGPHHPAGLPPIKRTLSFRHNTTPVQGHV